MNPSSHHQPPQQRQRRFRRRRVQRSKVKLFWRASWKFIRRNARYIAILLVTIVLSISFSATYLLPHTIPFEGNLVVEELGFTTTQVQPLFDKVQIKELVIRGQQTYIFSGFKGDFENKITPQIKELEKLTISVRDANSSLTIKPVSAKDHFQLSQLNLPANTQVSQLRYEPTPSLQLAFSQLEPSPNNLSRPLTLNLGVPMQITVQGNYEVTELKQQGLGTFAFTTTQALGEFKPPLPTQVFLRIKLNSTEQDIFFGNNMVERVRFAKEERLLTGQAYNYDRSSIRSGVIRIAAQTVAIEKDQFIKFGLHNCADKDGCEEIKRIPYIRVMHDQVANLQIAEQKVQVSEPNYGLEVGLSGKTSHFEIGINPSLPIKVVQGNYISRLPLDIANFLNFAFTSIFSGLFTWLLTSLPQKN